MLFFSFLSIFGPFSFASTEPLKPWEVLRLTTFSPSGRPGSSPWSVINITISDQNNYNVQTTTVECGAKWTTDLPPYGQGYNCSDVPYGSWTFRMLKSESPYSSPTQDFGLQFTLVQGMNVFDGSANFAIGDNLRGLCSASGVCAFQLKEEMTPFAVEYTKRLL
ncbi:hypothetical protein B0H67DRAFT_495538 [Lasiosphaeris hirsuta]|uniref:Uncharacterized protein n=1 Tax=Lasiosphaeris hirsuta TaxID=260670 RepID=A0AA40A288_9PEZI|nr:hypothetical protein B0H67DRAFT_495538 [Lasiosphaeris hirsuta]